MKKEYRAILNVIGIWAFILGTTALVMCAPTVAGYLALAVMFGLISFAIYACSLIEE
jgi:hypothetical protein